jgi:hypothetical protein
MGAEIRDSFTFPCRSLARPSMLLAQQAWHGRDCSRTPELFTMPSDKSRLSVNGTVHEGVRAVQATSNSRPAIETQSGTLFPLKPTCSPSGTYLYVSDPEGIQSFGIDSISGALTPLPASPLPLVSGAQLLAVVQVPPSPR